MIGVIGRGMLVPLVKQPAGVRETSASGRGKEKMKREGKYGMYIMVNWVERSETGGVHIMRMRGAQRCEMESTDKWISLRRRLHEYVFSPKHFSLCFNLFTPKR